MISYYNHGKVTYIFALIVFLSLSSSVAEAGPEDNNGFCADNVPTCIIIGAFSVVMALFVLAGIVVGCIKYRNESTGTSTSTTTTENGVPNRTNERHVVVNMGDNNSDSVESSDEINQPPPSYFKDSTPPKYTQLPLQSRPRKQRFYFKGTPSFQSGSFY